MDFSLDTIIGLYIEDFPEFMRDTKAAAAACMRFPHNEDARTDLCRIAHQIRGTAGSYGFVEISKSAGAIEDMLRASRLVDLQDLQQLANFFVQCMQKVYADYQNNHQLPLEAIWVNDNL
jgi:chemotaxis protein histidine kinase CheA